MSSEKEIEDDWLGRWLAGELTGNDLKEFEASDAFKTYQAIAQYSNELEAPAYEVESELQKLNKTIAKQKEPAVIKMPRFQRIAIAAGYAVLIGLGLFWIFSPGADPEMTSHFTAQGETKSVKLPDNSEVTLNIASNIEYDAENWEDKREIHLDGEAYFDVEKGKKFTVNTDHGSVEVLGTEFNIRNRQSVTEVICYEGKVKVTDLKGNSTILEVNDAVRLNEGELEDDWSPAFTEDAEWKNGFSSFHNAPFANVIEELENQYEVQVDIDQNISDRNYVGAFPHDNLNQALQLVFEPMQMTYTIKDDSLIVID